MVTVSFTNVEQTMEAARKLKREECKYCKTKVAVKKDGTFHQHKKWDGAGHVPEPCKGSGKRP
jgi:hypothetical protein